MDKVQRYYAERECDSDELMPHYLRHVSAMTAEGLHAKSAIAAELAFRDAQIATLQAERDALAARVAEVEAERDAHAELALKAFEQVVRLAEVERDAGRWRWMYETDAIIRRRYAGYGGKLEGYFVVAAVRPGDDVTVYPVRETREAAIDAAIDAHAQGHAGEGKDGNA